MHSGIAFSLGESVRSLVDTLQRLTRFAKTNNGKKKEVILLVVNIRSRLMNRCHGDVELN